MKTENVRGCGLFRREEKNMFKKDEERAKEEYEE